MVISFRFEKMTDTFLIFYAGVKEHIAQMLASEDRYAECELDVKYFSKGSELSGSEKIAAIEALASLFAELDES